MKISKAIANSFSSLKEMGDIATSKKWQAIDAPGDLFEIINRYIQMEMPETKEELGKECDADLPWAENHFQERINPNCNHNPGYEYQNWPYYKVNTKDNDKKFRKEGEEEGETFFSHTYMERFWPDKTLKGTGKMGYNFGDFADLIQRLKDDPGSRQAFYAIWHPQDSNNNGVRLPCTIGYHFLIRRGKLHVAYLIRSCDIFRHFKNDIYMTVRLAQYVKEQVDPSLKLGTLSMWIGSLHCWNVEKALLDSKIIKYESIF
ncbi:MAG TPA: thymidylate synthase [Candidatus Paceibacterota bacterium]|jgi:thymidylate synthase|nr:thymidylate synthase [Candidatus Paceibacterota bacterium]